MADVKRLNYFTSQFLVEKDFKDEQAYFIDMRRRHNQLLHTWGVADGGLQVSKAGDKSVAVGPGMAIDKDGKEIVLLDAQSKDLGEFGTNADVYLTIKYQEVWDLPDHYTGGGLDNYIRATERPLVEASKTAPPADGSVIVLAKVRLDSSGNVSTVDNTVRKMAGSVHPTTDLAVRNLSIAGNGSVAISTATPLYGLDVKSSTAGGIKLGLEGYGGGQLIIKNNEKDNKVFLEAFSADGNGSAAEFLLTGRNGGPVPKLSLQATIIKLGLEGDGGGQLIIGHGPPNDNKIFLEAFSADGNGSAAEFLLTGRFAQPVPKLSLIAKDTYIAGNVSIGTETPAPAMRLDVNGNIKQHYLYLSGGGTTEWSSFSYNAHHNDANNAWVFPDPSKVAMTVEMFGNDSGGTFDVHSTTVSDKTKWNLRFRINGETGEVTIPGHLTVLGGVSAPAKEAYVVDRFINSSGDTLEQGDVVVLAENQASLYYGLNNTIPVPEVDLTVQANDSRICGIVCDVLVEEDTGNMQTGEDAKQSSETQRSPRKGKARAARRQNFTREELANLDRTKVESSQLGKMVTLGAFAHCKVDADIAPIKVGDLLTTSPTKGHAQKVTDSSKAVGAILGKALGALKKGKGMIPVLVTLQ